MKRFPLGLTLLAITLGAAQAEAKCSIRVADPLIAKRYQECNTRTFLAYLYNDLVTPFSFTCAKKLSETCRQANCASPKSEDEAQRCQGHYVEVLNECTQQIDDAARMARCKDTKVWPVEGLAARAPARMAPPRPMIPAPAARPTHVEDPVSAEPLPAEALHTVRRATRTSQSSRAR